MNRFRTKKRVKEETSALSRPSQESDSSLTFLPFRKGKKAQEPDKVEIDLSSALPSTDEFRTSLLMTGLSARFSMLREQDDPNTKIGKASDDSVLYPKRQSRLDYGGFRGLGDIAEVESLKAAAPFARKNSYNSDDADSLTANSMMGRPKPNEGNNLFGGRQKIYKITAGAGSKSGMGGRALYDDDVALSAFQRWRQEEKERKSFDGDEEREDASNRSSGDVEALRAESPVGGYNRKRETTSTTSSIPSMARNSTAATSVTSQRTPSLKDWQPSTAPTTSSERGVTRARRLYEPGLNHDLQEQQSFALSRIDTLTRQRTFGTRTPDLVQNSPSPTAVGFPERLGSERKILAQSSAPNLRSMSPPTTASSAGTLDLGVRIPSATGIRPDFGGVPPVSPPISETEENSILPIHPNDRGKATALGVFQKPSQPYDDSLYAQRQLQRQQGRETPIQKPREEPDVSRSSSPTQKKESAPHTDSLPTAAEPSVKEDVPVSFLADPNDSDYSPAVSPKPFASPQVLLRRPSDSKHPALRDSGAAKSADEPSTPENTSSRATDSKDLSPEDSPTLGPVTGAGLSGMVRQHLRGDSNGSSIYGVLPQTYDLDSRFQAEPEATGAFDDLRTGMSPWDLADGGRDWTLDLDVTEPLADVQSRSSNVPESEDLTSSASSGIIPIGRDDRDEFASQLADRARRVRERLTTYVESDSRSTPFGQPGDTSDARDQPPHTRQTGMGPLQSRTSRGSLIDRSRDQSKAMKMLGLGASGSSQTGSPVREPAREEGFREVRPAERDEREGPEEPHAGLRAFRQARRELQRVKEMEMQTRRQYQPQASTSDSYSPRSTPTRERPLTQSSPSRERNPPSAHHYQQRPPSEELILGPQRFGSREHLRAERGRSDSDSSNDGRSSGRPPYPANNANSHLNVQTGPSGARPPMRSPGLPGTDIKRSPIMPPHPYPGSAAANRPNFGPGSKLRVQTSRGYEPGQPSPASMPSPYTPNGPLTPGSLPSSPRPVLPSPSHGQDYPPPNVNDPTRRRVKTMDISDPTSMKTSRVPTVALPPDADQNRDRSNSRTAPPLPPINPRRRQDVSHTRAAFENGNAGRGDVEAMLDRRRLRPVNNPAVHTHHGAFI
ncbi:hypothetical protein GGS23DRAFT_599126 [Durotheca rogersii]|uniref:uncharacterized protein n=1 Tax=Durotheca rogersii TaxID=419775 RepID=UPI00221EB04D|nr:uncharacterized protein GGS23DRAFT_599126 [Durotheca rogersii]KAI5860914.1 hypothetical protein GGS23DRAFT_599126 [Durotheca rogersii]